MKILLTASYILHILFSLLFWDKIINDLEIKVVSNVMAFPMVSQILLFLFQNAQQHSKPIAKKYFPSKERFSNDRKVLSVYILKIGFY